MGGGWHYHSWHAGTDYKQQKGLLQNEVTSGGCRANRKLKVEERLPSGIGGDQQSGESGWVMGSNRWPLGGALVFN